MQLQEARENFGDIAEKHAEALKVNIYIYYYYYYIFLFFVKSFKQEWFIYCQNVCVLLYNNNIPYFLLQLFAEALMKMTENDSRRLLLEEKRLEVEEKRIALIVLKLKTLSPAALMPSAAGSKSPDTLGL